MSAADAVPDDAVDHGVYDVLGIGLGPFNLGLAALLDGADELAVDAAFLEQKEAFSWHEGMLIDGTTLEVPFLADLVTLADPTNPHSYLNYLRERDRLYEFYFYETFQIPRREYDHYCGWVADSIPTCRFGRRATAVHPIGGDDGPASFAVVAVDPETGARHAYRTRDLVVGIGSRPYVPESFRGHPDGEVFHTAAYLDNREAVLDADPDGIAVVGSGQSAAEVFEDLLDRQRANDYRLDWLTRSEGFFPMEYSKLGLQHFTPDYVRHFNALSQSDRDDLLAEQDLLYKGIDPETSAAVYEALYERSIGEREPEVGMIADTEVREIERTEAEGRYRLRCARRREGVEFVHDADRVVLGTGYHRPTPAFLDPLEPHLDRDDRGRLRVRERYDLETTGLDGDGRVFVQNAELHTHGVGAPDLGLGCFRNAAIVDRLVEESPYPVDEDTVFQDFAAERFAEGSPATRLLTDRRSADD